MVDFSQLQDATGKISQFADKISQEGRHLKQIISSLTESQGFAAVDPSLVSLTILVLACFIGYYVVWNVTPALHSPLMAVTNAISSVIIVGSIVACGPDFAGGVSVLGFLSVVFASVNIFGGFLVTQRMLAMFTKSR